MRRLLVVAAVVLTLGCRGDAAAVDQAGTTVREPSAAGQYYPADARTVNAMLDAMLRDALAPGSDAPIAIVAPHAGWVFSGQIAADAWRQAAGRPYDAIVLLGTNHTGAAYGRISVYPGSGLRTPLGTARVDTALSAALVKEDGDCVADTSAHAKEHSVEVHVPFAQRLFPNVPLVAVVVGTEDPAVLNRFGKTLARVLSGRRPLIVASSDLSHYPSWRDAVEVDHRTLEAIASLDPDRLAAATASTTRATANLETCACGDAPIRAAIAAARALGANRGRTVSYANSGDLPTSELDRVVGYGAVVYSHGAPGADTQAVAQPAPSAQASAPTSADRKQMLALARETIRRYLDTASVPLARGFSPALERPLGVFVTLRKRGDLRGCIGQMTPDRPLRMLVGRMALAAAFEDPRFERVRAAELKDIEVEISVLTPFKAIGGPSAIVVGRDGVLLEKDRRSAVFLPQVATEEGWTRDQMLDNLCQKGGLDTGCWRSGAKLSTFQADVFKEGDFK
jgi:AmmeMemoRadiSam system protein B/AmmeMemoRadiSam system protein A